MFSPGSWYVGTTKPGDEVIAYTVTHTISGPADELSAKSYESARAVDKANAYLAASGPELYDALDAADAVLEFLDDKNLFTDTREQIKKALAKARGEA